MERRQHVYADMAVASWIRVRSAHIQSEAPVFILDHPQRRMGHHTRRLPASGERWVPCAALVGPGDAQGGAHCGGDESDDWKVRQHKREDTWCVASTTCVCVASLVLRLYLAAPRYSKVTRLNELEFVGGEIWANVWFADIIARIDPSNGDLIGTIDCSTYDPPRCCSYTSGPHGLHHTQAS